MQDELEVVRRLVNDASVRALLKIRDGGFIIINLITPTTIE